MHSRSFAPKAISDYEGSMLVSNSLFTFSMTVSIKVNNSNRAN